MLTDALPRTSTKERFSTAGKVYADNADQPLVHERIFNCGSGRRYSFWIFSWIFSWTFSSWIWTWTCLEKKNDDSFVRLCTETNSYFDPRHIDLFVPFPLPFECRFQYPPLPLPLPFEYLPLPLPVSRKMRTKLLAL